MSSYFISASILSADMTRLGEEIENLLEAGIDMVHFDVMDQHYVPNLTLGPFVCEAIHKRFPALKIDVHLMTKPVDDLIIAFSKAGAYQISIHPDSTYHLDRSLSLIQEQGCKAGLVINPATSPESLTWSHHRLHTVLIMTVNPGFGGQMLIPEVLPKISDIKKRYPALTIAVDGGVNVNNIKDLAEAGCSEFVIGSGLFKSGNYVKTMSELRAVLSAI